MVAAGAVRARVVCLRLCVLGMILGACVCVASLSDCACKGGSWIWVLFLMSACGVRAVCDGLKRAFYVKNWRDHR